MYIPAAEYAQQLLPYVQRVYPELTPKQHVDFATYFSTHFMSGYHEGTCNPIPTEGIEYRIRIAAKDAGPELLTPPPTPHEALALIEKQRALSTEARMTKFRELSAMTADARIAAVDIAALIAARAETPPPVSKAAASMSASQSAADRWNAMSSSERIEEAAFVFGKERHRVLPSDLRKLDDAAKPDPLAARDAQQIASLKARDPSTLSAADRMTLHRAEHPPRAKK